MNAGCVTRLRAVEQPALRLFLFHCAGGSHLMFRGWDSAFPADWELVTVEAPGRGRLADHPLAPDTAALAEFILPAMTPLFDAPFAFFGHSMGGLVAYDLTLRLAAAGLPQPAWVGVSARRWPEPERGDPVNVTHLLPDGDLRRVVLEMGGTPQAFLDDPRLWAIIAPVLRADLRIGDIWQRPPAPAFVAPPLSVFAGADDPFTPQHRLEAWRQYSGRFLGVHHFPGGHFYLQHCLPGIARRIIDDVAAARRLHTPA